MNVASAIEFVQGMCDEVGIGYHPDTFASDYQGPDGKSLFTRSEAAGIDLKTEIAHAILGDKIYDVTEDWNMQNNRKTEIAKKLHSVG